MSELRATRDFSFAETVNFVLTNRLPRRLATRFMGWFSRIENPIVARLSIAVWRAFVDDLRLEEAEQTRFASLHDCFTRRLKAGARPFDPDPAILASPCDAVVGAVGRIDGESQLIQAKGFPYRLDELVASSEIADRYRGGQFITLRLKSSMYHRFHAPCASRLEEVRHIAGDTWNVNPITLARVERLFCRNERAVLELDVGRDDTTLALIPIAAILVAGIRLHCLPTSIDLAYAGPERLSCDGRYRKGDEMGYFHHGSTIVVLARGPLERCEGVTEGRIIRAGQPLLRWLDAPSASSRAHNRDLPSVV